MTSAWPPGLLTPLVTPLRSGGLDKDALATLLEHQIEAGVSGVVVGGGSGEHGALGGDERRELAEEVAATLDGRLPFVVQAGALATRDSLSLSLHAEEVGAAGILLASPFGEPINWRERKRFYEELSDGTGLPIMIYNTPPSGLLELAEVEELAALPNISAIKDSSGQVTAVGDLLVWSVEVGFPVYTGYDSLLAFAAAAGAHGMIMGVANVIPGELMRAFQLSQRGELGEEFRALWRPLRAFLRFMEDSSNYVALCKYGLRRDGLDVGEARPPFLMPLEAEQQAYGDHLEAVKLAFASQVQR